MTSSLVGSEMCIRDRCLDERHLPVLTSAFLAGKLVNGLPCWEWVGALKACLLYTSDAADDM
eukprot:10968201-Prorocentrum_lima.AAC.1